MYKYFVFVLLILSCGFIQADNVVLQSGTIATISPDMSVVQNNNINKISLIYCDDDVINGIPTNKHFSFTTKMDVRPGKKQNICVVFTNHGDVETTIKLSIVEGKKGTGDSIITCENYEKDNTFEKLFLKSPTDSTITLKSGMQLLKVFLMKIPKNATGNVYGCLTYTSNEPVVVNDGQVFAIQVRKAGSIDINVTGDVYNFGRRDDMKYTCTTNKQTILKVIIGILSVRIILTIIQTGKKKKAPEKVAPKK